MTKLTLSVYELSQYLGIGLSSAYNLVHMEGFPVVKVNSRLLVPHTALDLWLEQQAVRTNEEEKFETF